MIYDTLSNWTTYFPGNPVWRAVFEFLLARGRTLPQGRHPILGDDAAASVAAARTRPEAGGFFEAHRRAVDVQLLLEGRELIRVASACGLSVSRPYDDGTDCELYEPPLLPSACLPLEPGRFAVFFPQDAHQPLLAAAEGPGPVEKVVVKIKAALLR